MISVIVPVYQVENYIINCLKSLSLQTFKDFEIIIVNDGSKDKSINLAKSFLENSNLNYYITNQENQGVSSARNHGINLANGEWIVCIDSDDILHKNFLKYLYEGVIKSKTDISMGSFQMVNENNLFKPPKNPYRVSIYSQKEILYNFLVRRMKIISPAILVKKELITSKNIFYNENMSFSEDVHWIWRLLFNVNKISYIHAEIYNYNLRPNSTMTSSDIRKVLTGYYGFVKLNKQLNDSELNFPTNIILDRWVLGSLRSSSKMMSFEDFCELTKSMNYKVHMKRLINFPDYRVKILSNVLLINRFSFYSISKLL